MDLFSSIFKSNNNNPNGRSDPNTNVVTVVRERQTIVEGVTLDRTNEFRLRRSMAKKQAEMKTRQMLDFLAKSMKNAPASSSFLSLFSKSSTSQSNYCPPCGKSFGLLDKKNKCKLCEFNFCNVCIRKLTNKDITGILQDKEEFLVCNRCFIIVTREENQRKFKERWLENYESLQPLINLYVELIIIREEIRKGYANYEYLSTSICDGTVTKKSDNFGQIYQNCSDLERELHHNFKSYQVLIKKLAGFPALNGSRLEKLKNNVQRDFLDFIQDYLPRFRRLEKEIIKIEKNSISNLYVCIYRICNENMKNALYWKRFGSLYTQLLKIVQEELIEALVAAGEKWEVYRKYSEEFVNTWESQFPPVISDNPTTEFEGRMIRKNISALKDSYKKLEGKLGTEQMQSKKALKLLFERLEAIYFEEASTFDMLENSSSNPPQIKVEKELLYKKQDSVMNMNVKESDLFEDFVHL